MGDSPPPVGSAICEIYLGQPGTVATLVTYQKTIAAPDMPTFTHTQYMYIRIYLGQLCA